MFAKSPGQYTPKGPQAAGSQGAAATSMSAPMQVPAGASGLQDGPAGQLAISQIQSALKCKLPGCHKPCYMEVGGRVHDFCSKAHAMTYTHQSPQQTNQPITRPPGPSPALTTMPEGSFWFVHYQTMYCTHRVASQKPSQPPPSSSFGRPASGKVRWQ